MIGIICAMEEELDSIINLLEVKASLTVSGQGFAVHRAEFKGHDLVFILCGIGKVNAAIHTQYLIDSFNPNYIINVGVAGSLSIDLSFGDVVIANDLIQHDIDVSGFGIAKGQIPRMDVFSFSSDKKLLEYSKEIKSFDYKIVHGRIATGDQFIDDKQKAEFIHSEFGALACEMEGAAIAHACYVNKVPFIVIRALSDMAGRSDTAIHSFEQLKHMTANRSSNVVKQLLERM